MKLAGLKIEFETLVTASVKRITVMEVFPSMNDLKVFINMEHALQAHMQVGGDGKYPELIVVTIKDIDSGQGIHRIEYDEKRNTISVLAWTKTGKRSGCWGLREKKEIHSTEFVPEFLIDYIEDNILEDWMKAERKKAGITN